MKILVIGDYISDVYTFGKATRLCPEAPVPVIVPEKEETRSGGAGLVRNQLQQFGANVDHFFFSRSTKKRFFADNRLLFRIDIDAHDVTRPSSIDGWFEDVDAFVISDYGKGAMTRELARQIVDTGKPCFVDAKHHWEWYAIGQNVWLFPNEQECANFSEDLLQIASTIVQKHGSKGCKIGTLSIPATVSEVVDVTGAGDIFMASFVYAWSLQLPAEDCLRFANEMAGESCRHLGTYVVTKEFADGALERIVQMGQESRRKESEKRCNESKISAISSRRITTENEAMESK